MADNEQKGVSSASSKTSTIDEIFGSVEQQPQGDDTVDDIFAQIGASGGDERDQSSQDGVQNSEVEHDTVETQPPITSSTPHPTDVFAQLDTEEDDPFAQIAQEEPPAVVEDQPHNIPEGEATEPSQVPHEVLSLLDQAGGDEFDSLLGGNDHAEEEDQVVPLDTDTMESVVPVEKEEVPVVGDKSDEVPPTSLDDKDFSDLLAEFEAENDLSVAEPMGALEDNGVADLTTQSDLPTTTSNNDVNGQGEASEQGPGSVPPKPETLQVPVAASALFGDDSNDSAFDEIIPHSEDVPEPSVPSSNAASPSPVPSLSIEHSQAEIRPTGLGIDNAGDVSMQSMFSNASDWLQDTTFDDSIQVLPDEATTTNEADGHEPVPFEVPQGWYDDNGDWNWYTEEEKEQVRQAMLDQGGFEAAAVDQTPDAGLGQDPSPSLSFSPGLQARVSLSENAARRTPQPESDPSFSNSSYDPYAPPGVQYTAASSSYNAPNSSQYSSSSSPYAPYAATSSAATPYTPAAPYDPYSPPSQPAPSPYAPAPSVNSYQPRAGPSSAAPLPPKAEFKPPIKRAASNAYDPPFLRPQKSFVRPPTAVSAISSPAFDMAPAMPLSPPQASQIPAPPPAGPPRRAKGDSRPPSTGPSFAPPPSKGLTKMASSVALQQSQEQAYGGPPRPPSASEGRTSIDRYDAYSPPQPSQPASQSYQPPPHQNQQNYGVPPGRTSAASDRDFASPPQAAAPVSLAPPPSESPYAPPRTLSRGPPSRGVSPLYEARPPPRPDVNPGIRPPSQSGHAASIEQLLSPPKANIPLRSENAAGVSYSRNDQRQGSYEDEEGFGQSQYGSESLRVPQTKDAHHLSPLREEFPDLSRKYDEDGEDGEVEDVRNPYGPSQDSAPSQSDDYESRGSETNLYSSQPYQPPEPSVTSSPPAARREIHDPYGPSSLGLVTQASPFKQQQPSFSPYMPYSPTTGGRDTVNNPYAPPPAGQTIDISDDIYGPSTTNTSPTKHRFAPPRQPSRASTASYEPSAYSPAGAKPLSLQSQQADPYGRSASPAYSTSYGMSPPTNNYFQSMPTPQGPSDDTYVPQQVLEQRPVSEDPLGRSTLAARNAPIAMFGFGGLLITAFPGAADSDDHTKGHSRGPSYGYASGRGQLWIRSIAEVAAPTAFKSDIATFPGPLIYDPSTVKGAVGEKKKKEAVLAYLEARSEEIEKGLPYLKSSANRARREEEGKLVLVKLLKALIVGEGKLAGSPEVEEAIRTALSNPGSPTVSTAPVASVISANATFASSLYPAASSSTAAPVSASPSQLTELSGLLAQGHKRDAALYAADHGLWSHALVISSSVDPELWKEIVARFTTAELTDKAAGTAGIKAAYTLFGGLGPASVDELISAASITDDPSKDQWREVISSVFFHGKPTDQTCLDDLGSRFLSMGLINAAHTCFLLSPLSPFFDFSLASYDRGIMMTHNSRDEESIIFAEVAEYARSLVSVPKGQELPSLGLPQLLPFKLARAWRLAELGDVELAQRYCSAIAAGSKTGKGAQTQSLLAPPLAASLEDLLERLTGTPSINPANALGRKAAKPGFDKLGSWIEGRLTKFIAGEEGEGAAPKPTATNGKPAGPFAHFSTISPNASGSVTRTPSLADFHGGATTSNGFLGVQSISRTTSPAAAYTPHFGGSPSLQTQPQPPSHASSVTSSYGDQYGSQYQGGGGSYSAWGEESKDNEGDETPHIPIGLGDEGDFINPMAQLSLGANGTSNNSYEPPAPPAQQPTNRYAVDDDDEDDLGFGNKALSREKTPKPPAGSSAADDKKEKKEDTKPAAAEAPKTGEQKASWLGRLWGKKEGEGSGPVKAKLGEESSMVFDPELKRWVVKGAKGEKAVPNATPPPPRAQTASPSRAARPEPNSNARATSATPPPSQLSRPPPGPSSTFGRSTTAPLTSGSGGPPPPIGAGFAEGPDGGIRRMKSSLAESVTANDIAPPSGMRPPPPPGAGGGPPPPSRPSTATGASLDDLLSRPPSKRPASAMKKGARNRYVDVFQPGAGGAEGS
ncbi:hypothetical protein CI109_101874 [Kwoniella shandongensis]|uniref:Protein transport protein sec16 n=1 Tax=Kwoniella shandongensis TaxID=1734106 RepID=A0A5M6BPE1_9TREE|nr:uncharacterized protein CI109_007048 [Kwoniella shandongensis]KAA5524613.1 hypothetical protein CI109_007048 [Kwoniella shandongensis]